MLVHPGGADFQARGDCGGAGRVATPHRAGQAKAGVVGARDGVLDIAELQHREHRAELFLGDEAIGLGEARHHRRRDEVSTRGGRGALDQRSMPRGIGLQFAHALVLAPVLDRTQRGAGVEAIAKPGTARLVSQCLAQRVVDVLVGVDALHRHAHLAAVHRRGEEQLPGHLGDIDIGQHDGRIVAAQFEGHALERGGRAGHHLLAGGHRAGERDLVHARMRGEQCAQFIAAREHADDAGRQDVAQQLADAQRGQRGERRGLDDGAVARVERRSQGTGRQVHRRVPRRDDARDAQRAVSQRDVPLRVVGDGRRLDGDLRHAHRQRAGARDLVA